MKTSSTEEKAVVPAAMELSQPHHEDREVLQMNGELAELTTWETTDDQDN